MIGSIPLWLSVCWAAILSRGVSAACWWRPRAVTFGWFVRFGGRHACLFELFEGVQILERIVERVQEGGGDRSSGGPGLRFSKRSCELLMPLHKVARQLHAWWSRVCIIPSLWRFCEGRLVGPKG